MSGANFYVTWDIDRATELRRDEAWLAARLADARTRVVPVWRNRNLLAPGDEPAPIYLAPAPEVLASGEAPVLLGLVEDVAYFAIDVSRHDEPPLAGRGRYLDLREVGPLLPRLDGAILAYARGMTIWQRRHMFCGRCGSPTESREAGHVRVCSSPDCGAPCFPRTDPAVIMLVHDGGDRVLLGRQRMWRTGQHSVLAGFVEPGESLEQAVAREVREEVGIAVTDIAYHSSQPWPFPSSIMLGFVARALEVELRVNRAELEHAAWYSREEVRNSPEDDAFRLPRRDSISRRLIEDWLAGG